VYQIKPVLALEPWCRETVAWYRQLQTAIDIFVKPDAANAQRILTALAAFGFASVGNAHQALLPLQHLQLAGERWIKSA
jgi:hypothetical protein